MDQSSRSVCVREVQRSLAQSVKRLLEIKIEAMNAGAYFEVQEAVIKSKRGDGLIIFQGMQNHTSDSIKSLEGYDRAWCEEAQSLSQRSLDLLRPTIRKPDSELWFTWNPNQATDPVDNLLRCDKPPPDAVTIEVNFESNPWFPDVLRAEMEYDKARDPDKYAHVWRGAYVANSTARVFRNWAVEEFDTPKDAVHRLGADWGFAVDPTVLIRCHIIGRTLYIDHEAYMVGCEVMDTPALFMTVPEAEKWPMVADSARPETISHMRKNGFPKIMPAVKGKDSIAEGVEWLKSYDIVVHPRCRHLIDELTLYNYKTDPLTAQVMPVLADKDNHCLVAGTMVATEAGDKPIEAVTLEDRVLTRSGYKRVLFSGRTDVDRQVVRVTTTAGTFVCTPNHKVFTSNRGFVRADALRYNDDLLTKSELSSWLRLLNIAARSIDAIRKASGAVTGFTSSALSMAERCGFIAKCGLMSMAQSLMDTMSTIRMATRSTTGSKTLSACLPLTISAGNTNGMTIGNRGPQSILKLSGHSREHGIAAKKGLSGIVKSGGWLTRTMPLLIKNAGTAERCSRQRSSETWTSFAQTNANRRRVEQPESMTSIGRASTAEPYSSATSTGSNRFAPCRVLTVTEAGKANDVFDLTIEDQHEFFANGVLVHNCIDALRYACEGIRRATAISKPVNFTPLPVMHKW